MNIKRFKTVFASLAGLAAVGVLTPLAQASAEQQIQLYHRLPETKAMAVKDLVERFNAQAKGVKVVLSEAG